MKVLVTGGAGFIGSALVRELINQGNEVVVYDDYSLGHRKHLRNIECQIVKGSILDGDLLGRTLDKYSIEQVFHLAARPFIPEGFLTPERMITINTVGSMRVFLECSKRDLRTLYYSTSEVYGTAQYAPMDEKHPLNPQSAYAVSKAAADRIAYIFFKEKNFRVTILRQFNCFTPDTQVATPEGLKFITELRKKDPIFTLNPITNQIEIDKVKETISARTDELISLSHKSLDFLVSPEHRFFLKSHQRKKFNWYLAKDLILKQNQYNFPCHLGNERRGKDFDPRLLKLMAWYISEGYIVQPYETRICQRRDLPPRKREISYRQEIKKLIEDLGYHPIDSYHYLGISSKKLVRFLNEECGSGSHRKRMPKFILSLNIDLRKLFFSTLMKGDGHRNRQRYTTVSRQLADDVLSLGLFNGMRGRIKNERGPKGTIYRVDFRSSSTCLKPNHIKRIKTKDSQVHCIIAQKNHLIYAGRNGRLNWIGQCYGPRETHPYIVPEIIRQLAKGDELHLGDLTARRDFTFVEDAVKGHILLINCDKAIGEVVNQGSKTNYTMQEIVWHIADIMKKNPVIHKAQDKLRPFDVMQLISDYTKANSLTGWTPTTDIKDGLKKTVDWYLKEGPWSWE